jgi:Rha family phage regulatory protein
MNELVFKGQNEQVLTNSLLVAEKFCKEHGDVLKAIDALVDKLSENQCEGYFAETSIDVPQPNGGVRNSRVVVMNRDGFTLLVMGFTGKKALKFKLEYIAAFNAMEKALKEQQNKKLSGAEFLLEQAKLMVEQERRLSNVENEIEAIKKEREENGKFLLSVSMSSEELPQLSMRDNIRQLVNKYASAMNIRQQDVWHKIYDQLYYLYHISIRNYKKARRDESKLEIAERNHFLDKIYNIISNLVREMNIS